MSSEFEHPGCDRRRFPRLPVETPVEVLYPSYWDENASGRIMGMTQNLSEGGVCFTVDRPIPHRNIVLHLDYQGMGAEYVLGSIVEDRILPGGTCQYHCRILRSLGAVDPMSMLESFTA
jgi:hypothetical protein